MKHLSKILAVIIILGAGIQVTASALCPQIVRAAINKYKAQDYVGCIQDLEEYSQEDPSNAVAYYYTGIAYMQVGMKDSAIEAFQKVATINSVPVLSSYAIQATNCMNTNMSPCVYKKYSVADIESMVANPAEFFAQKAANPDGDKATEASIDDITDIDKLIQGQFAEGIHPDANKVIQETRLIQEQERVNAELNRRSKPAKTETDKKNNKSDASKNTEKIATGDLTDKEIADAVRTLSKAGYKFTKSDENVANNGNPNVNPYKQMAAQYALQDDAAQMALMFGGNNNNRNNSFENMLPYLLMQEQQNNDTSSEKRRIDPELLKTMLMNQMMGDFDLGFDNKNNR